MIWHGLLGRKIAEYRNPSNILYKSLPSYFVEFFWKAGLLILAFKRDIYKYDSSREESLSSLPEVEWAVAESQRGMTQDEVKLVCQSAMPWKTGIFLRGRVELFTGGWVNFCWVTNRDDAGWSETCMPTSNALNNGHLPERKDWVLYRRVSEQVLSPKERRCREWEE